ncbi:DUF6790 family protein [Microvirga lotononidis]|uniref:Uncharacterized protein n=1 Tax=Microvirga lotononidis TaxID=864069 RepID=I4YZV2_9HYPH|nr:DUF6790 family protein [Microvirga lotononidis]EIM29494.1 hypothetical protein MicloDRAFT_00019720 [Microvirga lotononidis]WQO27191.1 DUF6790 family protein [Microvirga lotononidis]
MYPGMIALTMIVLPLLSIGTEYALAPDEDPVFLIGKWFVFWAVGVRLLLAGLRQIFDPAFTAATIFKIEDPDARKVVVELGFGNVAIASLALLSVHWADWVTPAALVGAVFYGLAGLQHLRNRQRTGTENIAMASDLWIAAIAIFYLTAA